MVMKSQSYSFSMGLYFSSLVCLFRGGSFRITFRPRASAFWATFEPTFPTPIMPMDLFSRDILFLTAISSKAATMYSATELAFEPGADANPIPLLLR